MALLDFLTGGSPNYGGMAKRTAKAANKGIEEAQGDIKTGYTSGLGALDTGLTNANQSINTGYGTGVSAVNQGYDDAQGFLNDSQTQALGPLQDNLGLWNDMTGRGQAGVDYHALLSGQQGGDAALSALDSNPYGMIEKQGQEGALDRLERHYAGTGQPGAMALDLARGLSDRRAGALTSALASQTPYFDLFKYGTAGMADANKGISGLYDDYGRLRAGLATGRGDDLSNLATGQGQDLSQNYQTNAGRQANLYTGQGQDLAELNVKKGENKANMFQQILAGQQAEQANNSSMWGNIFGLGSKLIGMV